MRHEGKFVREESEQTLAESLVKRGVRMTRPRRELLAILDGAKEHLNAQQLIKKAQGMNPPVNRATVYRTLELLKGHGLLDELDLMHVEGHQHYYEARSIKEHLHVVCLNCAKVIELSSDRFKRLREEIIQETGFDLSAVRLEVGGRCPECRSSRNSKRGIHPSLQPRAEHA